MSRWVAIALLQTWVGLSAVSAFADDLFPGYRPFEAEYLLTRNGIGVGQTRIRFELAADGSYFHHVDTGPSAMVALVREDLILEQSRGRLEQGRPRPHNYLYRRSGGNIERELALDFDWPAGRVRMQGGPSGWSLEVPPDTLDKLIQQQVLSAELAAGAETVQFQVADGGLLKTYSYQVLKRESVEIPMGRFDTLQVERRKGGKTSDYTLWIAPSLGWQPVRILRRYRGASYRMELESLEFGKP